MPETETIQAQGPAAPATAAPGFADILCPIDGKEGGFSGVEHAVALAGTQGRLTFLAVTSFRAGGAHRAPAIGPAQVAEILEHAEGIAREAGVSYTSEVDPGTPPARVILDWSARYDLLALGAPSSSWPAKLLSVGVGDKALGGFANALLVARPLASDRRFGDHRRRERWSGGLARARGSGWPARRPQRLQCDAGARARARAHQARSPARAGTHTPGAGAHAHTCSPSRHERVTHQARSGRSGDRVCRHGSRRLPGDDGEPQAGWTASDGEREQASGAPGALLRAARAARDARKDLEATTAAASREKRAPGVARLERVGTLWRSSLDDWVLLGHEERRALEVDELRLVLGQRLVGPLSLL